MVKKSFEEQKAALDYDAFGWANYWSNALTPLGYNVMEFTINAEPMQRAWAKENLNANAKMDLKEIALRQVKCFKPEILWFEHYDEDLLIRIRSEVTSIKLVMVWVGSAIPQLNMRKQIDLILSCAPESVEYFKKAGYPSAHLHHGFDPRINERLKNGPKLFDFSFIGQLLRGNRFHLFREQLLEQLVSQTRLEIFSPVADFGWKDNVKALLTACVYNCIQAMKFIGFRNSVLKGLPLVGKRMQWSSKPILSVNRKLKPFMKPAVFGLEMFQVLRDSKVTLNIHADSSPYFASNMRLFETTGVGSCLVTDWKKNLHELFEPDKEVVVYKTADECVEKVKWLLDNPKEREEIARAGQLRTLKEHTFAHRAVLLDDIIKAGMNVV